MTRGKRSSCTRRLVKNGSLPRKRASDRSRTMAAKAAWISWLVPAFRAWIFRPVVRTAGSRSRNTVAVAVASAGFTSTATRAAVGTSSCRSSSRFAVNSPLTKLMPVALPPGRERLAKKSKLDRISASKKTMGIVVVAALAANVAALALRR